MEVPLSPGKGAEGSTREMGSVRSRLMFPAERSGLKAQGVVGSLMAVGFKDKVFK